MPNDDLSKMAKQAKQDLQQDLGNKQGNNQGLSQIAQQAKKDLQNDLK